jgi:hypothetical protein
MRAAVAFALLAASCGFPEPTNVLSGTAEITGFQFEKSRNPGLVQDVTATIRGTNITATLPYSFDDRALIANFFASDNADVEVATVTQANGVTVNDFSSPLTYTVSAPDLASQDYSVVISAPGFGQAVTFATPDSAMRLAVGDLNGDGKPDIAIVDQNASAGTVAIFLDTAVTGATTPSFSAAVPFATGAKPIYVAIGDLNGDGKRDLAVANFDGNSVSVLLNTTPQGATTPTFLPAMDFAVGAGPSSVAIIDVNGDGETDLLVAVQGPNAVDALLSTTAAGSMTASFDPPASFAVNASPTSFAIADFNGDGRPDVATVDFFSNTLSVLLDTTTAGMRPATFAPVVTFATPAAPGDVAAGDFDGDGRPDIVTANEMAANVSVFVDTTVGASTTATLAPRVDYMVASFPSGITIGDVAGSAAPDIAVACQSPGGLNVLPNTSVSATVSFDAALSVPSAGGLPYSIVLADFNGDGLLDVVVGTGGGNVISVQLGQR